MHGQRQTSTGPDRVVVGDALTDAGGHLRRRGTGSYSATQSAETRGKGGRASGQKAARKGAEDGTDYTAPTNSESAPGSCVWTPEIWG